MTAQPGVVMAGGAERLKKLLAVATVRVTGRESYRRFVAAVEEGVRPTHVAWERLQGTGGREQPHAVTLLRARREQRAARECHHVLLTLILERTGCGVHPRIGLKLPEAVAVAGVERGEAAIAASHEYQPARCRERAAETFVVPLLAPGETVCLEVDGGKYSAARDA